MDILLAHGYFLSEDPVETRVMKPYPPLGILSLSAWLKRERFSVEVFDATFESLRSFETTLFEQRPPVVGIYVNMVTKFNAIRMIRMAKNAGAKVLLGGPEPANYAEEFLTEGADVVVVGEGEQTLSELLRYWKNPDAKAMADIPGLVFRNSDGSLTRTTAREKMKSIDDLPVPDRPAIDLHAYMNAWKSKHGYSSISLITMRGCPYTCKWCSHAVYGESYRRRDPALVVDEIEALDKEYSPDYFWFADDVFTIHHGWLNKLAIELKRRDMSINFECITRADRLNDDVIDTLAEMGCHRIWIGAESGSQRILDAMSRGVKAAQVEEMTRASRAAGIEVGTFIMLGYLGEEKSEIEETVRYLKRSQPDTVLTTVSYPIKGTGYYAEAGESKLLPETPFSEWNDRDIDIAGRYSKRFYWYASRRLVNETTVSRLWNNERKDWGALLPAYLKAKIAQAAMLLTA